MESAVGEVVDVALGAGVGVAGGSIAVGVDEVSVQFVSARAKIAKKIIDCFFIMSLPFMWGLPDFLIPPKLFQLAVGLQPFLGGGVGQFDVGDVAQVPILINGDAQVIEDQAERVFGGAHEIFIHDGQRGNPGLVEVLLPDDLAQQDVLHEVVDGLEIELGWMVFGSGGVLVGAVPHA